MQSGGSAWAHECRARPGRGNPCFMQQLPARVSSVTNVNSGSTFALRRPHSRLVSRRAAGISNRHIQCTLSRVVFTGGGSGLSLVPLKRWRAGA